jgi:hypothetical protein
LADVGLCVLRPRAALAADPAMARIVLIEIVGATPAAEHARAPARNAAAKIIEVQLEQYPYWRQRAPLQRHVASLAAMAAIGEPISEFVAHGLISPKASWPSRAGRTGLAAGGFRASSSRRAG